MIQLTHQQKAIAWKHGLLSKWKLKPEQQQLIAVLNKAGRELVVMNVARKIGKSTTCVTYALEQAIQKKQHIRYATAFLTDLQEFILPIFEMLLADCPQHLKPQWHASTKTYRFPNGSVIKLVGLDKNKNGLRGNIIDLLIVDEAGFVANLQYLYRSVIIPATKDRPFKLVFPSTPPESPEHFWASELVNKAKDKGTYIEMTIDADTSLSPEERKRLLDEVGGEFSSTAQREYFCRIQSDSTRAVAPSFTKDHVQTLEFDPAHINWMLFGDSGAIDKTVFLEVGYSHDIGKVIFRSELTFPQGITTSEIIQGVKDKWGSDRSIVLDATLQLRLDYSAQGLPASYPNKDDFGAGILLLNNELHNNRMVILPECSLLIRTLEGGLLNTQRTDHCRTDSLGHNDYAATAIYALRGVDKTTDLRPRPNPADTITMPTPSQFEKNITSAFTHAVRN